MFCVGNRIVLVDSLEVIAVKSKDDLTYFSHCSEPGKHCIKY